MIGPDPSIDLAEHRRPDGRPPAAVPPHVYMYGWRPYALPQPPRLPAGVELDAAGRAALAVTFATIVRQLANALADGEVTAPAHMRAVARRAWTAETSHPNPGPMFVDAYRFYRELGDAICTNEAIVALLRLANRIERTPIA